MTEADALDRNPQAVRIASSLEVRTVPENEDEMDRLRASAMLHPR